MSMKTEKKHASLSQKQAEALLEEIMKQGAMQAREQQERYEEQLPGLSAEDYDYLRGKIDSQLKRQRRKRRVAVRTILVAAILICAMAAFAIGGGALNEYISRLSPKFDSKGVDMNTEKENIIATFDGRPVEEHYAEVVDEISGLKLVIPENLPQGSVLEYIGLSEAHNRIRISYNLSDGVLVLKEYLSMDDANVVEYKVLENNKVDYQNISVMGRPAQLMTLTLEQGDVRYIITWTNDDDNAYYLEFRGNKQILNMILDDLEIFEKK